ncbi:MAG: YHS domain-containing (seleno)protein [Pseudomonadota bacterium]
MTHRTIVIFIMVAAVSLLVPAAASALEPVAGQGAKRLVIRGYDTTAYFTKGGVRSGSPTHEVRWKGATWRFATATDAAKFRANPTAFAPQFGGYCTGGLSQRHVVTANPRIWRIHRGKLYMFAAQAGGRRFDKNPAAVIRAAHAYWKTLPVKSR